MPSTRRIVTSAAVAATVALPMTTVALAAPALASQLRGGVAHGYRFRTVPAPSLTDSHGSPYAGPPVSPYGQLEQPTTGTATSDLDTSAASSAEISGLVRISTVIDYGEGEAAGTGIVVSSDGVVVTNHHVVQGATSIKVTVMSTGQTYTAELLGSSTRKDVAVLQLEGASGLTTAVTDSTPVSAGQTVTAVGDAGGATTLTAAPGTVSALRQTIQVSDEETGAEHTLRRLIEVSSDVVAGDSGGALRTADGDVVGMTVAASTGTTSATVDGYVIPWSRVLKVERAVLAGQTTGVVTGDITLGYSAFLGVQLDARSTAAAVAGVVDDSPAQTAGLAAGDTVTSVGGTAVSTATQLRAAIATHRAGDSVTVTWTDSSGAGHRADVTLTQGPIA